MSLQEAKDFKIELDQTNYKRWKPRVGQTPDNCLEENVSNEIEEEEPTAPLPFLQLFRYSTFAEKLIMLVGILSATFLGFAIPAVLILFGYITQTFVDLGTNITIANSSVQHRFMDEAVQFGLKSCIVGVGQIILDYILVICFSYSAERQIFRIRTRFLKSLLHQDVGWYDTNSAIGFCSKITENLQKLQEGISDKGPICLSYISSCAVCFGVSFFFGWKLTLIILSTVPAMIISSIVAAEVQGTIMQRELNAYASAGAIAEEVLSAIKTVVAFGGQKKEVQRFSNRLVRTRKNRFKRAVWSGIGNGSYWFLMYTTYALSFWYGIKLILDGKKQVEPEYDASNVTIVSLCLLVGSLFIGQGSPFFEIFSGARSAASDIFNVIERVPTIDSSSEEGLCPETFGGFIEFCDVYFHYPSRPGVQILKGLNFKILPGETLALVGESGCGKSTIIQLLQRFYDPVEGMVKVDGVNIKDLNLQWLRSHFGVVSQEPVLFGLSVADNIRLGKKGAEECELNKAAQQANAHDFIMKLPDKYDTMVGERGAQLSGGQKQRVAIARALVRNPRVLLLDEATSALDLRSEKKVQKALDTAKEGRTTIIIAHRLSTIRSANRILVISKGQIQEEGAHDFLMKQKGLYYQLVTAQLFTEDRSSERVFKRKSAEKISFSRQSESPEGSLSLSLDESSIRSNTSLQTEQELPNTLSMCKVLKANLPEWPYLLIGFMASTVQGFTFPAYAVIFGEIIGALSKIDDKEIQQYRNFYSLCFLLTGVVSGLAVFLQFYMFSISGDKLTLRLRKKSFEAMLNQEIGWYDDIRNNSGALCCRLASDAANVHGASGIRLGVLIQGTGTMLLSILLSIYLNLKLGLAISATVPVVFASAIWESKMILNHSSVEKRSLEEGSNLAIEAVSNIRTVASLGCQDAFETMYSSCLKKSHMKSKRLSHLRGIVFGLSQAVSNIAYGINITYGAYLVLHEGMNFTSVFKVGEALIIGAVVVGESFAFAPNYTKGRISGARIFQLLERQPRIRDSQETIEADIRVHEGSVDMEDIYFHYQNRPKEKIIRGINLNVADGHTVALVGSSGCGKSTCLRLLLRFYDPTWGRIMMDTHDIRHLKLQYLRAQLGLVSQEPVLFDRTIAENIAYGDNSRTVTMDEIVEAAVVANIHKFVCTLPQGYDTRVGEHGIQLSGGQKQRVAIARALVRNPKVLLLDEATSALDSGSEKKVQEALERAQLGRTSIVIAHRLSTIRRADLIVVIDQGQIVESGNHSELMENQGLYYKLCSLQGKKIGY